MLSGCFHVFANKELIHLEERETISTLKYAQLFRTCSDCTTKGLKKYFEKIFLLPSALYITLLMLG